VNVTRNVTGLNAIGLSRRCPSRWMKFGLGCFKYFSDATNCGSQQR